MFIKIVNEIFLRVPGLDLEWAGLYTYRSRKSKSRIHGFERHLTSLQSCDALFCSLLKLSWIHQMSTNPESAIEEKID